MTILKVTILCVGRWRFPRCSGLLGSEPGVAVVGQPGSFGDAGHWLDFGRSDILILDEAVIRMERDRAVRSLLASYLAVKSLLILENERKNSILSALSLGIQGVVTRDRLPEVLLSALTVLSAGEAWVPRDLVEPLRHELIDTDRQYAVDAVAAAGSVLAG